MSPAGACLLPGRVPAALTRSRAPRPPHGPPSVIRSSTAQPSSSSSSPMACGSPGGRPARLCSGRRRLHGGSGRGGRFLVPPPGAEAGAGTASCSPPRAA